MLYISKQKEEENKTTATSKEILIEYFVITINSEENVDICTV